MRLRSNRPYRKAWDDQKALDYIIQNAGTHFDPDIVNLFVGMMEKNDLKIYTKIRKLLTGVHLLIFKLTKPFNYVIII